MARISLNDAMARPAAVDREKLDATTEEDIGRYRAEDGFADAEVPADARTVVPPRELRVGLGLTQREMAARLRVPFDTWRNWETGRVSLDPAVRSLLDLVAAFGERAFAALAQKRELPVRPAPRAPVAEDYGAFSELLAFRGDYTALSASVRSAEVAIKGRLLTVSYLPSQSKTNPIIVLDVEETGANRPAEPQARSPRQPSAGPRKAKTT